jgi:branched-chain amino acid transport system permease protein
MGFGLDNMPPIIDIGLVSQVLFWGAILGCIYILIASGLNLIFGVMKLVNFAHGEFVILGGYVSYWAVTLLNINPYAAIFISMMITGLFGVAVERTCFRRVLGSTKVNEVLLSVGLIYILQNSMALAWTDYPQGIHSPYEKNVISLGTMKLNLDWAIAIAITIAIMVGLYVMLNFTETGRAMRATSQNRRAATLMGIDVERIDMLSFGIGISLAAAAGTLLAIITSITPTSGSLPALKAFAIIVLGGLGSPAGAVIGGLTYGVVEGIAVFTLGGTWRNAIGFVILILVLIFRPTGLFGKGE